MNITVDILEKDNQEYINIDSSLELELLNKRIVVFVTLLIEMFHKNK